jgi:DNA-binding XRE family transcriptional regulator
MDYSFVYNMRTIQVWLIVSKYCIAIQRKGQANMILKNLVKLREGKGWSREKLAVESGVSYNTIVKIEYGGIDNPKIETVIKFADALDVSIDKLVGR